MGYADEPRQCLADGEPALFHLWAEVERPNIEDGRQVGRWKNIAAVVELRSGEVRLVRPAGVRFLDGLELFSRYAWGDADG